MGPKLLFFLGIMVTHAAVGAALMHQETPLAQVPVSSCSQTPGPLPYFGQQGDLEMLAQVLPADIESGVMRP